MKIAILSDIHSNFEALLSVMKDIKQHKVNKIYCIGDLVGYGPQPEEVVNYARENNFICTKGNHELALFDNAYSAEINDDARKSILITSKLLSKNSLDYLHNLPDFISNNNMLFVHGCPPDSITDYLFYDWAGESGIRTIFKTFKESIAFIGHTHNLEMFIEDQDNISRIFLRMPQVLMKKKRYIINIGSVGQPRDGYNNKAKYVIFDNERNELIVNFVEYDIDKTVKLINEKSFPFNNGLRLYKT